jgi:cell division septation protein DedD
MAVLGFLLLAACGLSDDQARAQGAGQVVADSGFRPKPHGFSFENWGGKQHPQSLLTADDAAYLFGDQVCARKQGASCVATPAASMWIAEMNRATEGGHCEGMAALSAAFYVKSEKLDDYGAAQAFALKPDDGGLMRNISTYFSTQALEPVRSSTSATRGWSLQKIVDHLGKTLTAGNDYPTLGIYGADGGHAITPYKIESQGAGRYRIHVYDNNYPGAEKFVDVDTAKNRWTYGGAALNPSEDPAPWQGGAGSMDVTLLSDRYQQLQCPFCGPPQAKPKAPQAAKPKPPGAQASRPRPPKPQVSRPKPASAQAVAARPRPQPARKPATASQGYSVITPSRCTQVQAVGKLNKQQIRMGKSGPRSQIEGASMRPLRGSRGCVVSLPGNQEYDVRLVDDGKPSSRPLTGVTVFAPGKVYSVSDVAIRPGAAETVRLGQSAFTYHAGSKQKPTVRVGGGNDSGNGYYEVSGLSLNEGYNFSAGEDEDGRVTFSGDDPELEAFDLRAELVGEDETVAYEYEDVDVGDDGQVLMDVGDDGEFEMAFVDDEEDLEAFDDADFEIDEDDADLLDEEGDGEADELIDEEADGEADELIDEEGDELTDKASGEAIDGKAEDDDAAEGDEVDAEEASDEGEAEEESYESDEGEAEEESYESDEGEAEEESYESDEGEAEEESYESDEGEAEEESYEDEDE